MLELLVAVGALVAAVGIHLWGPTGGALMLVGGLLALVCEIASIKRRK